MSASRVKTYHYPRIAAGTSGYRVTANGEATGMFHTDVADFACVAFTGTVIVEVTAPAPITAATVHPLSKGITPEIDGCTLRVTLERPMNLSVQIAGDFPLYLFANALETDIPSPDDPAVRYFAAGQVYEVGDLQLNAGETLYIEGGAVVRGNVHALDADGVVIRGHGILDGGYWEGEKRTRTLVLEHCHHALVEDIIIIRPTAWTVILAICEDVTVRNIKEIGECMSSDGIDVVGSRDVRIDGCFIRNADDCVVIKSLDMKAYWKQTRHDWGQDVRNVLVTGCTLLNFNSGSALEIGVELRTGVIEGVTFRDIDVVEKHGFGSVFSIQNGDRALVRDIRYENIRVEHCYDAFITLRVIDSRYSRDTERGQIRDITFKDIHWHRSRFNVGYTPSLIGGWDAGHTVENVTFDGLYYDDHRLTDLAELELFTRFAEGVRLV